MKSNRKNKGKGITTPTNHKNIACMNGFEALRIGDPGGSNTDTVTISWNVRGINTLGKYHEVISRLKHMNPDISILIETRVKPNSAKKVMKKFDKKWNMIDNYVNHNNGRIWIL